MADVLEKVRIPELPVYTPYGELSLLDRIPWWMNGVDKTVYVPASQIRTLLMTGGTVSHPGVYNGGKYLYIVPPADAGTFIASIPSLAGKDFYLERAGFPLIPQETPPRADADFEILAGGGFKLLLGSPLQEGERFLLDLFSLQAITPGVGTPITTSLFKGTVTVANNKTLSPTNDLNKLIQLRGGASQITATMPILTDVPDNTPIVIEAVINNTKQNCIATQGGQNFYLNNTSYDKLYLSPGDSAFLFKGADGYYVLFGLSEIYKEVGRKPQAAFNVGSGELLCDGSTYLRATYPRLWQVVQTLGASFISESAWIADNTKQGCFSDGDGSTTFRVPDMMNMFLRAVKTTTGSDAERPYNKPGGRQEDEFKEHDHDNDYEGNAQAGSQGQHKVGNVTSFPKKTGKAGGVETRPVNIGVLWVIKY